MKTVPVSIKFKGVEYKVWFETVTPERAQQLLASNPDRNRKRRPGRVSRYAADIAAEKWHITGEAIRLDEKGDLLNGQHRLAGVVLAGKAADMLFIAGISAETMLVQDTGLPTAGEDWMPFPHAAAVVKVIRALTTVFAPHIGHTASRDEIMSIFSRFGEDHIGWAATACGGDAVGRKAAVRAALAVMHKLNPARAMLFAKRLSEHDLPADTTESVLHRAFTARVAKRQGYNTECLLAMRAAVAAIRDNDQRIGRLYEINPNDKAWLRNAAGLGWMSEIRKDGAAEA